MRKARRKLRSARQQAQIQEIRDSRRQLIELLLASTAADATRINEVYWGLELETDQFYWFRLAKA
eukprot:1395502-Pyramimonas_sp.AAC.1